MIKKHEIKNPEKNYVPTEEKDDKHKDSVYIYNKA